MQYQNRPPNNFRNQRIHSWSGGADSNRGTTGGMTDSLHNNAFEAAVAPSAQDEQSYEILLTNALRVDNAAAAAGLHPHSHHLDDETDDDAPTAVFQGRYSLAPEFAARHGISQTPAGGDEYDDPSDWEETRAREPLLQQSAGAFDDDPSDWEETRAKEPLPQYPVAGSVYDPSDWEETRRINTTTYAPDAGGDYGGAMMAQGYGPAAMQSAFAYGAQGAGAGHGFSLQPLQVSPPMFSGVPYGSITPPLSVQNPGYPQAQPARRNAIIPPFSREFSIETLQATRTTMPPPAEEYRRSFHSENMWKIAIVVAAFIVAVTMIFNTPEPQHYPMVSMFDASVAGNTGADFVKPERLAHMLPQSVISTANREAESMNASVTSDAVGESLRGDSSKSRNRDNDSSERGRESRKRRHNSDVENASSVEIIASATPAQTSASVLNSSRDAVVNGVANESRAGADAESNNLPVNRELPVNTVTDAQESLLGAANAERSQGSEVKGGATSGMSHLDNLLTVTPQQTAPSVPSRAAVKSAMDSVSSRVSQCAMGVGGRIVIKIVVAGASGRVASAQVVDATFRGTSIGRCVASAVSAVRLPSFQKDKLTITYPFDL
ncbi:MAG: hypothetical protein JXR76_20835 [Deltaproteobacteria bacterium]|nr:hypothetical protein [Deltaproteobacteria bacterium]